jgi:hypothetical protein
VPIDTHTAVWLYDRESVTTWPSLLESPYTYEPNGQLSSEQMKAVSNPESADKDDEGVRKTVAGELSRKGQPGQGCEWPVVLAATYGADPRVLTTTLQPFPHSRPSLWLFPQVFVPTAVPFCCCRGYLDTGGNGTVHPRAQPASLHPQLNRCTKGVMHMRGTYLLGDPDFLHMS